MKTKLVPATREDIPELISLINFSFRGGGWCRDDHLMKGTRITREMLEEDFANPTGLLWKCLAADEEGEGGEDGESSKKIMAAVYSKRQPEPKSNWLYVGRLCVHPDYQSCGLGKRIMRAVEERAKSLNCIGVTLQSIVARTNLIEWYEKQGYRLTGERESLTDEVYGKFLVAPELLDLVTLQKELS